MKKIALILMISLTSLNAIFGQTFQQYFDGADTTRWSLKINIASDSNNIWQIGKPNKSVFDSAATLPNALVTDTLLTVPQNNISRFTYSLNKNYFSNGILAIQWKQKLDMEYGKEGGMVEISIDSGNTWKSPFNNPYVYNFYGFDTNNVSTLPNGDTAFTGTDSTWKDIWLCYDISWLWNYDSILLRHSFISDSTDHGSDGWMIDNMLMHVTWVHTVNEVEQTEYMKTHPNPTSGRVNIQTQKKDDYHIIEEMRLVNSEGRVVQMWNNVPTKFFIDIGHHKRGIYFLKVRTNFKTVTHKIVLDN